MNAARVPKSKWAPGPWHDEPDVLTWHDEATGLMCEVRRSGSSGALCGYVGVEKAHPLYGCHYDGYVPNDPDEQLGMLGPSWRELHSDADIKRTQAHKDTLNALEAHGGLTFAAERDGTWWFGFDCAHFDDLSPGLDATLRSVGHEPLSWGQYRDLAYVRNECTQLAKQLHDAR